MNPGGPPQFPSPLNPSHESDRSSGPHPSQIDTSVVPIETPTKLFVGGLSGQVTNYDFYMYFSQFGYLIDSVVMIDKDTGNSRGFGFVTYARKEDAESVMAYQEHGISQAVEALKSSGKTVAQPATPSSLNAGHSIRNKVVEIKIAQPKSSTNSPSPIQSRHHQRRNYHPPQDPYFYQPYEYFYPMPPYHHPSYGHPYYFYQQPVMEPAEEPKDSK